MNHGSLFSGIGGFDLAAEWMGWENIFHCEIAKFPRRVLKYYWPKSISYEDITKTDFTIHRGHIDVLTGGFPCQPFSTAGKQLGTADHRHLWPEMLRAIREIKPSFVVGENVRGLLSWNGGMVFDQVHLDLEDEGYEVIPFLLPACAVNAPHRRDRIWFVAYSVNSIGQEYELCSGREMFKNSLKGSWIITSKEHWKNFPTQSPVCSGDDGISARLDGITFSKWRNESIKGAGSAIVPQIALQIFKAIEKMKKCGDDLSRSSHKPATSGR